MGWATVASLRYDIIKCSAVCYTSSKLAACGTTRGGMLIRLAYWWGGFFVAAALAASQSETGGVVPILTAFAVWVSLGLTFELGFWVARRRRWQTRLELRAPMPADGRVEVVPVGSAQTHVNSIDRRFGALINWADEASKPHQYTTGGAITDLPFPRPMVGRVALASIFLGRDGVAWSDEEIAEAHKYIWRGAEWIERQAQAWSAPMNVSLCQAYVTGVENDTRDDTKLELVNEEYREAFFDAEETRRVVAAVHLAVRDQFGCDLETLTTRIANNVEADHLVWVLHSRSEGRSQSIDDATAGVGRIPIAICYARESELCAPLSGPPFVDPVTVIHEVLHAFGARDAYGTSTRRFAPGEVSERDIMLLHTNSLSRLRIDAHTARAIGWGRSPVQQSNGI